MHERSVKGMTVDTKELVTTIAYLIGVKDDIITKCFEPDYTDLIQKLHESKEASIIRYLSKIRTTLFYKFKDTDHEMRYNLKNLDRLEWYNKDEIKKLHEWGIELIKPNYRAEKYMNDLCELIAANIDNCSSLFYDWVNWAYIRDLFCIPKYRQKGVLKQEFHKFLDKNLCYPFQMYIHWEPKNLGSILYSDGKFLSLLYSWHGDYFEDRSKYRDATDETKNSIYDFVKNSGRTAIAVDCENSDVYKLYGVLKNLDSDELAKIEKIILYDDEHTSPGWDHLARFIQIPVEHIEVERVTDRKSLVDIKMTAGVCQNYYENSIDSFIIVSSDSDFWGLISSLPKARFIVMYEYEHCGQALKNALKEHDIYYCSIDDFCSGNTEDLKKAVLFDNLEQHIPDLLQWNGKELANHIHVEARIDATDKEILRFYEKYIKTLRLKYDSDGNVSVMIAK